MIMTDKEIREAIKTDKLKINNISESSFKPIAYVARLGKRALIGGKDKEIDLTKEGSVTLKAGDFFMFTTEESFSLSEKLSAHIGIRSYYARKGLILLAGMHIDPLWEGHLVLGGYNASPTDIVLDYLSDIVVIEFHQLNVAPTITAKNSAEQREGKLPAIDKDFIRHMETQSLSALGRDVRDLTRSVSRIDDDLKNLTKQIEKMPTYFMVGTGLLSMLIIILEFIRG